ncbi:MAG: dmsD2 [Symbiobacteriaceae bacterium]|nr:dmsD2 [Symbiobacteriaceae bacterium]
MMNTNAQALASKGELGAVLEDRGFAYGLLMQAFLAEPRAEQVRYLAESGAVSLFPFGERSDLIRQGMERVGAYLADPENLTDEAMGRLRWDYTRLFIGPDRLPAPPWESAYRTEEHVLFGEETLAVRRAFLSYGLVPKAMGSEPDDHIGLELNFMFETCRLAAEAAEEGDGARADRVLRDQQTFLTEHLLRWAPEFGADVAKDAQTGFYQGMALMLTGLLAVDRATLQELLQEN